MSTELPIEIARRLDELASEFEKNWSRKKPSEFQPYLQQIDQPFRQPLLKMLLAVEVELRQRNGQTVDLADYSELGKSAIEIVDRLTLGQQTEVSRISPQQIASTKPVEQFGQSKQVGNYKLLQPIGEGGMGTVWMAEQEKPVRRRVALKLIKGKFASKEIVARFEAERQALAMMDHQNIAKVLDAGTTENGSPYFVMELVKGVPLTQFCDDNKLSIQERLELFVLVCKAIQHAHHKGIIHRDLKPSNVLVTLYDGEAVPKVIDFGLAKALEHTTKLTDKTMFTEFGKIVGTLQYMSPEQAETNALDVDTRTDIYSLGVMLYELLTGTTPLDKATMGRNALLQVLEIIREKDPPRPSNRLSSSGDAITGISAQRKITPVKLQQILRGELDWVVMKALEKDRRRRYETANDFAEDIKRYLNDEAVQARPHSTGYKVRKFIGKNRSLVATTVTIATLLIGGIGGIGWFAYKADQSARSEKAQKVTAEKNEKLARENEVEARDAAIKALAAKQEADEARNKTEATLARSNYFLALARWDAGRAREAIELLDLVPHKYRHFEWDLANRQFRGGFLTCYGHTDSVTSVAYSPGGSRIASGSRDNTIKIWNATTGKELRTLNVHSKPVHSVTFSPDGSRIASGSSDNTIKILDATTGKELRTLHEHSKPVYSVSFSPDGSRIASASSDNTVKVWDANTGKELRSLKGHSSEVNSAIFSPDGSRIASASSDNTVKVWDATTGDELRILKGHSNAVLSVSFSPDGSRIASGSRDKSIKVWDTTTGKELRTIKGHFNVSRSVAFSPDGTRLISGIGDTIKTWDAVTGDELRTLRGHFQSVSSATFSPDGSRIASGSSDNTIKVWDATAAGEEMGTFRGHSKPVHSLAFSPDGSQIASGSSDNTVKVWDATTGTELRTLEGHSSSVSSVKFNPDGSRIASGSRDKTVKVWDANTGVELRTLEGHSGNVSSVSFSPDGSRIFSGSSSSFKNQSYDTIIVWDAATGEELRTIKGHSKNVSNVTFSPDGSRVAASGSRLGDTTIKVWDVSNGGNLQRTGPHSSLVSSVTFSPDGSRIASGSLDSTIKVWNANTGEEYRTLKGHSNAVSSVSFSPNGSRIASASSDNTVKVWDATTGEELRTLQGHSNYVLSVSFSPDGSRIASGSSDNTIKVWDATTGEELRKLKGHSHPVNGATFSPEGSRIASKSMISTIKVWDAATGDYLQTLKGHKYWAPPNSVILTFSPDASRIASENVDAMVVIWDAVTGEELRTLEGHSISVTSVAYSPDGSRIASGSRDKTVKVWDANTGVELRTLKGHSGWVSGVTFSPDGSQIYTESPVGEQFVWNTNTGRLISDKWRTVVTRSKSLSPDSRWFATGSGNDVLLVDLDFKKRPYERALLLSKAKLSPIWHREQAKSAEKNENWYATTFHRAWVMKAQPNYTLAYDQLHHAHNKLKADCASKQKEVPLLHPAVREALLLPRGNKLSISDAEQVRQEVRNGLGTFGASNEFAQEDSGLISLRVVCERFPYEHFLATLMLAEFRVGNLEASKLAAKKFHKTKTELNWEKYFDSTSADSDWLLASYFAARLMELDPDRALNHDRLHSSYEKLRRQFADRNDELAAFVHPITVKMLQLPRGKSLVEIDPDHATKWNNETWQKVKFPPKDIKKTVLSNDELYRIRDVVVQYPLGHYYNTLATAEYRVGNYEEAIAAALKSVELTPQQDDRWDSPYAVDFAILAMSHFKIGELENANEYHAKLQEAMKLDAFKDDEECKSFLSEVNELFESENANNSRDNN